MSKNNQKLTRLASNIEVWRHQKRGPEGSWTGLGRILCTFERLYQFVMPCWWVLGPFCGEKSRTWFRVGFQDGANMETNDSKLDKMFDAFEIDVFCDDGGFLEERWSHIGRNMESKIDLTAEAKRKQ